MVNGIILASGYSRRMGKNKLLEKIDGKYLIEFVINTALQSNLDTLSVVYKDDEVFQILGKYKQLKLIYNDSSLLGQSQSIKKSVNYLRGSGAFLFLVGDQPLISVETINLLISTYEDTEAEVVVPLYNGIRGNPVLFSKVLENELLSLEGDQGGRQIISDDRWQKIYVNIKDEKESIDVDKVEDLQLMRKMIKERN